MAAPRDTVAYRSVLAAETVLGSLAFPDPRLAPPLDLVLPVPPERSGALPGRRPAGGADAAGAAGTGPTPGAAGRVDLPTDQPTVVAALSQLRSGATSTTELVQRSIEVAARTAELGAVVYLDQGGVLAEAAQLDAERAAGRLRGPLHGVPITVKDVIDVAGLPTRAGSLTYDDIPKADAPAVARLREAGALILAKVATHEFALGVATPQCSNPHDPTRISGGSSGGSAIAVATGVGLASLGTDTRASLRVPSALCGVVGFKPSFAAVPTSGIVPLSWTVDHIGPIARDAADAFLLSQVLSGRPAPARVPDPGRPLVIGVVAEVMDDAEPDVAGACAAAVAVMERAGCRVVEIDSPSLADLDLSNDLGLLVSRGEAAAYHRSQGTDVERCIPEVRDQLAAALHISAADYLDAQRQRHLLSSRVVEVFGRCDLVAAPTTPITAPPRHDYERHLLRLSRNTIMWSLSGSPAASYPVGTTPAGMPIGLQLAARRGGEAILAAAGRLLEDSLA